MHLCGQVHASQQGCSNLAKSYNSGVGVKQNYIKANELYKKACNGGHINACFGLASSYYKGEGVKQNYIKAIELYKKACNGGYMNGCYILGVLY